MNFTKCDFFLILGWPGTTDENEPFTLTPAHLLFFTLINKHHPYQKQI